MKTIQITPNQIIAKVIQLAKLKIKELESYSNTELFKITETFADSRMTELKIENPIAFHRALNKVSFTESDIEESEEFGV